MRSIRFRRLVCGNPAVLIRDGAIQQDAMRRNRFTLDELIEELRAQGVTDLSTVKYAVLETNGKLSVLPYPAHAPLTPEQMGRPVRDTVFLPVTLVNDGRVLRGDLRKRGLDEAWLKRALNDRGYRDAREVLLMTIDASGKIFCVGKERSA